jgi:hypothetical protein
LIDGGAVPLVVNDRLADPAARPAMTLVVNDGLDPVDPSKLDDDHEHSRLPMIGIDATDDSEEGLVAVMVVLRRHFPQRPLSKQDWSRNTMPRSK